jgi:MFS family permease
MLFGIGSGKLHTGRRVQLVVWLQIMQEWVGIAGVTVYAPTIFGIAGMGPDKRQWISGLNNIFYMFATLICVFTLDRIGRRWTCYWGSVGQGIAMALAGAFSYLGQQATENGDASKASSYGNAAVSMVFIFTSVFGATWLTVISGGDIQSRSKSEGQRLGSCWLVNRQRLAYTALSHHVRSNRGEDVIHLRSL